MKAIIVKPELLALVTKVEQDINKAVEEAITLWLKGRVLICPITNNFCTNLDGSCNTCLIASENYKIRTSVT